jgi:hypothetical protein
MEIGIQIERPRWLADACVFSAGPPVRLGTPLRRLDAAHPSFRGAGAEVTAPWRNLGVLATAGSRLELLRGRDAYVVVSTGFVADCVVRVDLHVFGDSLELRPYFVPAPVTYPLTLVAVSAFLFCNGPVWWYAVAAALLVRLGLFLLRVRRNAKRLAEGAMVRLGDAIRDHHTADPEPSRWRRRVGWLGYVLGVWISASMWMASPSDHLEVAVANTNALTTRTQRTSLHRIARVHDRHWRDRARPRDPDDALVSPCMGELGDSRAGHVSHGHRAIRDSIAGWRRGSMESSWCSPSSRGSLTCDPRGS